MVAELKAVVKVVAVFLEEVGSVFLEEVVAVSLEEVGSVFFEEVVAVSIDEVLESQTSTTPRLPALPCCPPWLP